VRILTFSAIKPKSDGHFSPAVALGAITRAGLNEREAPGKVVTTRPPKRLAQLCGVSHALVLTLQKHRSKKSKLIRFGSLHFKDNWGEVAMYGGSYVVNLFKQKVYQKKRYFCYRDTTQQSFLLWTL